MSERYKLARAHMAHSCFERLRPGGPSTGAFTFRDRVDTIQSGSGIVRQRIGEGRPRRRRGRGCSLATGAVEFL